MKKSLQKTIMALCFVVCAMQSFQSVAQLANPTNLTAEVVGSCVDLTWERSANGQLILSDGFESETFPGESWTTKIKNSSDYKCTWFRFPTSEIKELLDGWESMIYAGDASAVVMFDQGDHSGSYMQDEWLITPSLKDAAFLDFYSYINPVLLDYGTYEDFPDHYYVKVSSDGGNTWEIVWDARYDMFPTDGWQQVSIPLNGAGKNLKIAFEAVGEQNPEIDGPLYFSWAIDNVVISGSAEESAAARQAMVAKKRADISDIIGHREFVSKTNKMVSRSHKTPQKAALKGYYNVYYDGDLLATNIRSLSYTDLEEKTVGEHVYKVTYYDAVNNTESEGVETTVMIEEQSFNPPTNLKVVWLYDEASDTYETSVMWEAPEGEREPVYYNVYRDGSQIAYYFTEFEVGQSGLPSGVYVYSVTASYEYPAGESEPVTEMIALGTRYPVMNLSVTTEDINNLLEWDAPKVEEGYNVVSYAVYRGNECLADALTETNYTDANAPEGIYNYTVFVLYDNNERSVGQSVRVEMGNPRTYQLPYLETFDGGLTPNDWTVENFSDANPNYLWRFDNFYNMPTTGGGFSNEFASVNTLRTGYTLLDTELRSPRISTEMKENEHLYLEFDLDYLSNYDGNARLMYSVDEGESWWPVDTLPSYKQKDLAEGEICRPQHVKYDLTQYIQGPNIQICWYYMTYGDGYLAIDNVKVYAGDDSGVESIVVNKVVESVSYTDLMGRRMALVPESGIYIQTIRYIDGTVDNRKVMIKRK